ncbi:hypothetical protein [Bacillus sp. V59.32b]|nr:hypothetical protein [Bacillus sp. V59.32b]
MFIKILNYFRGTPDDFWSYDENFNKYDEMNIFGYEESDMFDI